MTSPDIKTTPRIVVIGGGLVGASFAVAMGQLGIDTLVLEAHPLTDSTTDNAQPSFDERTVALTLVSQRIYAGLGVWDSVVADATAIQSIQVTDRGHFGATHLNCRDAGTRALGYVIANRALGQGLYKTLDACTSVQMVAPATVHGIVNARGRANDDETRVQIDTSVGKISAELVVIADGGRSQIASDAGLHIRSKAYSQQALVTRVHTDRPHSGRAYERFTADGPLALLPFDVSDYAIAWTLHTQEIERVQTMNDADFIRELQHVFGARAGQFQSVAARHVYPLSLSTMVSPVARRIAVIGNAAHTVHPVAGQGFNLGLRDVAALADRLSRVDPSTQSLGDSAVLADYARSRRADTRAVSWFTDGLISAFTQSAAPVVVGRNLLLSGLNLLPGARRELLQRSMGLKAASNALTRGQPLSSSLDSQPL